MPKSTEIVVLIKGAPKQISVIRALEINEIHGTCVACGEPVKAFNKSKNGKNAAHAEHEKWNKKCPLRASR